MIQDARLLTNNFWYVKNSQPIVYLTLGKTPEPVYGGMLDKIGAGGLETAYIQFAEALARRKCTVFMFSHCAEPHCHKGVYYVPFEQINEYILDVSPDILITSRWFDTLYLETGTVTKRIIWLHDAHFADPEKPDAFSKADMVVCSSSWHRNYIAERYGEGIAAKKIRIIPLSIDKTFFEEIPPKNANRMLYSSNPDRGLMTLLRMWKTIREQAEQPELFLTVTYGWEGLETWGGSEEWKKHTRETREQILRAADEAGRVEFTGRLNKKDLYGVIKNSTLCLYPNNFQETMCLSAIECQFAGTPLITSSLGALATTVNPHYNVLIDGDPYGEAYQQRFISAAVALLKNRSQLDAMAMSCRLFAQVEFKGWDAIADTWLNEVWRL